MSLAIEFLKKFAAQIAELSDTAFKSVSSESSQTRDEKEKLDIDDFDNEDHNRKSQENSRKLFLEYDEKRKRISDKWKRY
ncbi:MAG TPA: hypothetical protein V6D19_24405 [Stenomitos sp.]